MPIAKYPLTAPFVIFIVLFHRSQGIDGTSACLAADHFCAVRAISLSPSFTAPCPSIPVVNTNAVNPPFIFLLS